LIFQSGGPSGCGKSTLVGDILNKHDKLFCTPVEKIIYCAKFSSSLPPSLKKHPLLTFHEGLPNEQMLANDEGTHLLFCLDDLMDVCFNSDIVANMFTQGRHRSELNIHQNMFNSTFLTLSDISTIILTQNILPQYRLARVISLNSSYMIIFRNSRDTSQICHLARQIYSANPKEFLEFFNKYVSGYNYLLCDFTSNQADAFRFRSDILSDNPLIFTNHEQIKNCAKRDETTPEIPSYIVEF
jgi:hypothetical protein